MLSAGPLLADPNDSVLAVCLLAADPAPALAAELTVAAALLVVFLIDADPLCTFTVAPVPVVGFVAADEELTLV